MNFEIPYQERCSVWFPLEVFLKCSVRHHRMQRSKCFLWELPSKFVKFLDAIFFDDHVISENWLSFHNIITYFKTKKQTITSSNSTIETPKKDKKICSKLKLMKPEHQWIRSGVFIVNFEHIPHVFQAFLWLTLSK